jgi:thymidylate kinase
MICFIIGISGSGKTTIARFFNKAGEVAFDSKLNKGLFHFLNKDGKAPEKLDVNNSEWRKKYRWVLNEAVLLALIEKNKDGERIFVCGGVDALLPYKNMANKIFLLKIDKKTMLQRLNSKNRDNDFAKDDETQSILLARLNRVQQKAIKGGAISIDATQPEDNVVAEILKLTI